MTFRFHVVLGLLTVLPLMAADITPEQRAFFEQKVRPVLDKHCYECHAESSEKLKGSLLLDSKAGWERGGDTGAAIIPGDAAESLFMKMVRHDQNYDPMPPKSKISDQEIADLTQWINEGAFDPRNRAIGELKNVDHFDLEERKQWWSFQPIKDPAVPTSSNPSWAKTDYDHFIHAGLDEKEWTPATQASKEELLRRLNFDLIGLAPTIEEREAFMADDSPEAYEKVVDRLLTSPHFGEKWARHWMDAVRFGETKSFEFDYIMSHAYQYRNYLIKAFNEDVPYNEIVRESFAGDLIDTPRYSEENGVPVNESVKGTGFLYLTDGQHGPPDLHEDEARVFSGIIDTSTKAFLGVTVQCAQCHDHKFDAITTGDYYSWYGILKSSRFHVANTVKEDQQLPHEAQLKTLKPQIIQAGMADALQDINKIEQYLSKATELTKNPEFNAAKSGWSGKHLFKAEEEKLRTENLAKIDAFINKEAPKAQLDANNLKNWMRLLSLPHEQKNYPELAPLYNPTAINNQGKLSAVHPQVYETDLNKWYAAGLAFQGQQSKAETGAILQVKNPEHAVKSLVRLEHPVAGHHTGKITGALRSPDFILDGNPVELYAKGHQGTINLIIRNYEQVGKGPTTNILSVPVNDGHWRKVSIATELWKGHPAYLEVIQDGHAKALTAPPGLEAQNSFLTLSTAPQHPMNDFRWKPTPATGQIQEIWNKVAHHSATPVEVELLSSFFNAGLVRASETRSPQLKQLMDQYRSIEGEIPQPIYARSLTEGTPQDEPIYIRGNHKSLSKDANPRRNMDALGGKPFTPGESGRRDLAEALVDPSNPLVSRVFVNRLWHHIFGQGIVSSLNDFGKLGTFPSHPELLDYLAQDFMKNGWSMKYLIKKMVMSSTYQMSSEPDSESMRLDPDNKLHQHMPMKRLEAEMVRDHMLFCSNRLDRSMYGGSILGYTGDIPPSRGIPSGGPVDSMGRRSIYIQLRRNSLPTFLRAFGMPNAIEPIGARHVTNVPAQSLAMMNSEFAVLQAGVWAQKVVQEASEAEERIKNVHRIAFSREASEEELTWSRNFLAELHEMHQSAGKLNETDIWTEFCHIMMNRKEFIYLK